MGSNFDTYIISRLGSKVTQNTDKITATSALSVNSKQQRLKTFFCKGNKKILFAQYLILISSITYFKKCKENSYTWK